MNKSSDEFVAARIEAVRKLHGLSLEQLAEKSGISRATISRIERGETSPTAHVLGRLCTVFGMTMSQLVAGAEGDISSFVPWNSAATWLDPETGYRRTAISPPAPDYSVEVVHGELPVGASVLYDRPPLMGLEHHIIVLDGALVVTIDGQRHLMRQRDCLRFKLTGSSGFKNLGDAPVTYLVIIRSSL